MLAEISRIAGTLALLCYALTLVGSLRFPWMERVFGGLDRQYRVHHALGTLAFLLMLAHPLALAGAALTNSLQGAAFVFFPAELSLGVLAGWFALLLFIAITLTSFFDRLPHRAWHTLHALAWPNFGAAYAHSAMYSPPTPYTHLNHAAAGIAIGAVLVRAVLIVAPRHRFVYAVRSIRHPLPGVAEVELIPRGRPIVFEPGQFVFVRFFDERIHWRCTEYHPFTIASAPARDRALTLIIKSVGDCTERLQFLVPGALARIEGPFGTLFADVPDLSDQVWVGGGIGIAPFLSKAQALTHTSPRIDFYYCARSRDDAAYLADFERIAARIPQFRVVPVLQDRDGLIGADFIANNSTQFEQRELLLCGPPAMVHTLAINLQRRGVSRSQIHFEEFDFV